MAVVDGDTIDVATSRGAFRVRFIGIDSPEIGRDGEASECYAQEVHDYLDDLVYGHTVHKPTPKPLTAAFGPPAPRYLAGTSELASTLGT